MTSGVRTRVAIDFGTCNCAAAIQLGDNVPTTVRLGDGDTMPSAVYADGQNLLVGKAAINNALIDPPAFERTPKRHIGEQRMLLGGRQIPVVEVIAAVLGEVLRVVRRHAGVIGGFDEVVITHPEGWGGDRLGVLRSAAASVGVPTATLRLVSEPEAAAWYYSSREGLLWDRRLCVFDFGGGTCDVAVVDHDNSGFRVVSAAGDAGLGGDDFDGRLFAWTARSLTARGEDPAWQDNPAIVLTLADRVRDAKETLSESSRAVVGLPMGGTPLQITRHEFDDQVCDLVERAAWLTRQALDAAGPSARPVAILLSGGSSRIPAVHGQLATIAEIQALGDPKTLVARGALLASAPVGGTSQGGGAEDRSRPDHRTAADQFHEPDQFYEPGRSHERSNEAGTNDEPGHTYESDGHGRAGHRGFSDGVDRPGIGDRTELVPITESRVRLSNSVTYTRTVWGSSVPATELASAATTMMAPAPGHRLTEAGELSVWLRDDVDAATLVITDRTIPGWAAGAGEWFPGYLTTVDLPWRRPGGPRRSILTDPYLIGGSLGALAIVVVSGVGRGGGESWWFLTLLLAALVFGVGLGMSGARTAYSAALTSPGWSRSAILYGVSGVIALFSGLVLAVTTEGIHGIIETAKGTLLMYSALAVPAAVVATIGAAIRVRPIDDPMVRARETAATAVAAGVADADRAVTWHSFGGARQPTADERRQFLADTDALIASLGRTMADSGDIFVAFRVRGIITRRAELVPSPGR